MPKSNKKAQRVDKNESDEVLSKDVGLQNTRWPLAWKQLNPASYFFLTVCVVAQAATILISWPAWQVRDSLPNLPWIASTPQFPMGILLLASLGFVLLSPKRFGLSLHLVLLAAAIFMDQFRCQPQVLAIAFLTAACVWQPARRVCAWYLVSMWLWAGIHKLVSPDWFAHVSYKLLSGTELNAKELHIGFAWVVAISEVTLGILAWLKPKLAALGCVAIHVGIAIFLTIVGWNYSVLPWNICTAIVGAWIFWNFRSLASTDQIQGNAHQPQNLLPLPRSASGKLLVAVLLIVPIGLYFGVVRHCFTHSLYSGNLPHGLITRQGGPEILESWEQLSFPFPNERKSYIDFFALTAEPGDKLHVREPRQFVKGGYFLAPRAGVTSEITEEHFFDARKLSGQEEAEQAGIAVDDPRKTFLLEKANATLLKRSEKAMIYAIRFDAANFEAATLEHLDGLPNLEQVQLQDCELVDDDLKRLSGFRKLVGIGLNDTAITDAGLLNLKDVPNLIVIEREGTTITDEGLIKIGVPIQ